MFGHTKEWVKELSNILVVTSSLLYGKSLCNQLLKINHVLKIYAYFLNICYSSTLSLTWGCQDISVIFRSCTFVKLCSSHAN